MTSSNPEQKSPRLDEVDTLLPALIEINIWQARAMSARLAESITEHPN
jgi:hypothetical protein